MSIKTLKAQNRKQLNITKASVIDAFVALDQLAGIPFTGDSLRDSVRKEGRCYTIQSAKNTNGDLCLRFRVSNGCNVDYVSNWVKLSAIQSA